jgi:pyruvate kinase
MSDTTVEVPGRELVALDHEVSGLLRDVRADAAEIQRRWNADIGREVFRSSMANLASYLALRRRDLRALQRQLMPYGLSSIGRIESRVLASLETVSVTLARLVGRPSGPRPSAATFFAGEQRLEEAAREVFGPLAKDHAVALLVTCPTEAADEPGFMRDLVARGVEAVRINCAHDDAAAWERMIGHLREAETGTGRRTRVLMDLAGPKIRTGEIHRPEDRGRIMEDDHIVLVPPGGLVGPAIEAAPFGAECTLAEAFASAHPGERLFIDDGKIGATIETVAADRIVARVFATAGEEGVRLKPEKGLNFPDTKLECVALTDKDRADLPFIAAHADGVEYSFVQSRADVVLLQEELARLRPKDWRSLSLVLKIETPHAVRSLPEMVVQAASQQPTGVMIARGDLAVEIGFARLAEMQEEILWICEAAQVPVIWATQVMEHLVKKGVPSRGEMTDAAMSARAECVMLNKGPYLLRAIDELDALFVRMGAHQHKKTHRLRALSSW